MAQEEFDPLDLLSKVALLILEARTPDASVKGRVEGPHCSLAGEQRGQHRCSPDMVQCTQAQEVRQRIDVMWRNGIPSCMDILLFPDCAHGRMEAGSLDGATNDIEENSLLLERWSIKYVKKRHGEWTEGVVGSQLLQAVRSYLHFSQLSSWLASMRGRLPGCIAYRLYAPGDCGDVDFSERHLTDNFPSAIYGPHGVQVTVLYLPRLDKFPNLRCIFQDRGTWMPWEFSKDGRGDGAARGGQGRGVKKQGGYGLRTGSAYWTSAPSSSLVSSRKLGTTQDKSSSPKEKIEPNKEKKRTTHDYAGSALGTGTPGRYNRKPSLDWRRPAQDERRPFENNRRSARNSRKPAQDKRPAQDNKRPAEESARPAPSNKRPAQHPSSSSPRTSDVWPHRSDSQCPWILRNSEPSCTLKSQFEGNRQEKVTAKTALSVRETLESQLRPLELTAPTSAQSLDLHSPKVLMSDVFYNPAPATRRMQLDFSHSHPSRASPGGSQPLDEKAFLMKHSGQGGASPLSPLDLTTFLFNLQSLAGPVSNRPLSPTQPLSYPVSVGQAAWLKLPVPSWDWSQVPTPVGRWDGDYKAQHSTRFAKRALAFDDDSPAPGFLSDSSGTSESAVKKAITETDQTCVTSDPFCPDESQDPSLSFLPVNALDRSSSNFVIDSHFPVKKVKKEAERTTVEFGEDSVSLVENGQISAESQTSGQASTVMSPHSIPSSLSDPVNQTLRDLGKIIQAKKSQTVQSSSVQHKIHPVSNALSHSWSSSSSSSSTYSSSPKVSVEGGDRHSDSSTPTNLSASPLPEDQQSVSCDTKSFSDSSCLSPHANTFSSCEITSSQESSSQNVAESDSVIMPDSKGLFWGNQSKELSKKDLLGSCYLKAVSERPRSESEPNVQTSGCYSCHRCSPEPFEAENIKHLEQCHQIMHEGENVTNSVHPAAPFVSPHCEIPASDGQNDGGCVQSLLPSNTEDESVAGCYSSTEETKSPCTFYLESLTSPKSIIPATFQWHSQLDQEAEDSELISRLDKLYLQQTQVPSQVPDWPADGWEKVQSQSTCCGASNSPSYQSQEQSSCCGASSSPSYQSQEQSSCCMLSSIVQNGSQSGSSVGDLSPSSAYQLNRNHYQDTDTASDLSLQAQDRVHPGVSISNSFIVPLCQENAADQRQPSTKNVIDTHASNGSLEKGIVETHASNGFMEISQLYSNGTSNSTRLVAEDRTQEEDSVFYGEPSGVKGGVMPHCPTRTKSAPNFSSLSEKRGMREEEEGLSTEEIKRGRSTLRDKEWMKTAGSERLRHRLVKSASMLFNSRGGLPSQSSPAPIKRRSTGRFDYDETLTTTKAIKSAISLSRLPDVCKDSSDSLTQSGRVLSTSAPASTNCLLGNFEESILNGRLEPAGMVEGFSIDIGASGKFCPRHVSLPVTAYFFNLSDDNAPSPYLGHINLDELGKRGYHIPNVGTLQVTLFNPNKTVVKMFVVKYDLQDMPPNSQTVLRQRTVYQPVDPYSDLPSYLRYLIHLRISSSSSGKTYLHTDIRLIFARNKFEVDSTEAQYKLCSYTETPVNPKYSPKR